MCLPADRVMFRRHLDRNDRPRRRPMSHTIDHRHHNRDRLADLDLSRFHRERAPKNSVLFSFSKCRFDGARRDFAALMQISQLEVLEANFTRLG